MTEEIPATPGWVDERLDAVFAGLPPETRAARDEYLACLARRKAPGAPSDLLGAEFEGCRDGVRRAMQDAGLAPGTMQRVEQALEALEAEVAGHS